jgi:hypothetical protein
VVYDRCAQGFPLRMVVLICIVTRKPCTCEVPFEARGIACVASVVLVGFRCAKLMVVFAEIKAMEEGVFGKRYSAAE